MLTNPRLIPEEILWLDSSRLTALASRVREGWLPTEYRLRMLPTPYVSCTDGIFSRAARMSSPSSPPVLPLCWATSSGDADSPEVLCPYKNIFLCNLKITFVFTKFLLSNYGREFKSLKMAYFGINFPSNLLVSKFRWTRFKKFYSSLWITRRKKLMRNGSSHLC